jgi:hypothetical protein
MDQILAYETWASAGAPRSLIYYSGVMPDDPRQPPAPNPAYPIAQQNALREASIAFLERYAQVYLPNAVVNGHLDWSVFASPANPGAQGRARFDAQYWRVNVDPSERYVLSVTGSSQYRLAAGGSGIDNLFLAGDWIETGLNAGCMEATVTSGLEAARAIASAHPFVLRGERDWRTPAAVAHSFAAGLLLDPTR